MTKKEERLSYQRKFLALNSHPFFVCVKYLRWRVQPWGVSCIQLWEVPVSEKKNQNKIMNSLGRNTVRTEIVGIPICTIY